MKIKNLIIIIGMTAALGATVKAQEKGLFLSLSGNYGANTFSYSLLEKQKPTQSEYPLSYGAGLSLQYFFTKNWGLSLGAEFFDYNGVATYQNDWLSRGWGQEKHYPDELADVLSHHDHFVYKDMIGGIYDHDNFWSVLGLRDWRERQHGYVIQVPLMAQYQTKWGRQEKVGMYWSLGVKLQVPILKPTYTVESGILRSWAYYPKYDLWLHGDSANIPNLGNLHGFGNRSDTAYSGDQPLLLGGAASGEIGLLFSFSRRVDFSVGAYLDYGFLNVRKKNNGALIMPKDNDPHALDDARKVGDGLQYNGYLNSAVTEKANLLAFGAKATLRIKLDKLSQENTQERMSDREFLESLIQRLIDTIVASKDTFICCPIIRVGDGDDYDYNSYNYPMEEGSGTQGYSKKLWNPNNPASPNNPNNPNYAYPSWYIPDYVGDRKSIDDQPVQGYQTVQGLDGERVQGFKGERVNGEDGAAIPQGDNRPTDNAGTTTVGNAPAGTTAAGKPDAAAPAGKTNTAVNASTGKPASGNTSIKNNAPVEVGLLPSQEGPNNPASVQRNQQKVETILQSVRASIYFDLSSSELKPEAFSVLDEKVAMMKRYPTMVVALIGHTCDLGETPYNDELSLKRATAVRNYMVKNGIRAARLELIPMGMHHPDNPNANEQTRKLNRRVDFIVVQ